uniref:Potassium channel domain-containing protein n=1 Tax=Parascaris univalens TaxID=6257 RepID=A0A915AB78_PARUN
MASSSMTVTDPKSELASDPGPSEPSRKISRFVVEPVRVDFATCDDTVDRECNHFLFNDYFKRDSEEQLFSPYDLLMRLHFPMEKSRTRSRIEKFKNYWENYSFYAIWRKKFIEDHSCNEQDIWNEFFIASVPHLIINLFLVFYVIGGAVIFQIVDENIHRHEFHMVILFTFTTVATVGYGNIVPTTDASKIFCIFYTLMGVPLLFLSLTNIGQFLAEGYWIFLASLARTQDVVAADERRLPLPVVVTLLLMHSVIGGVLFHLWIDQMPIIPAVYFSFVSITTIGYGDITPTPSNAFQTFIIICYLAIGMVIMSTFIAALYNYLRRLHYLGRNFSGAANVEVWFGGTRMSVTELLHIVADQFEVSPKLLYDVLRDLDEIITAATDPHVEANIEVGGGGRRSNRSSGKDLQSPEVRSRKRKKRIKKIEVESNDPTQTHFGDQSSSTIRSRMLGRALR